MIWLRHNRLRDDRKADRWRRSSACSTTIRSTAIRPSYARDDIPTIERYPDGQTTPTPRAHRLHARRAARQRLRRARPAARSSRSAATALVVTSDKDGPDSVFERELPDADDRDLAAVLARVPDRGADRQGAEAEARDHGRDRLRPRRPRRRRSSAGSRSPRSRTRNSISVSEHVVMMILGARAQLHPVVPVGGRRRLEHRRLRRRAPTTSRACRSARSPPAGSARRCCAG